MLMSLILLFKKNNLHQCDFGHNDFRNCVAFLVQKKKKRLTHSPSIVRCDFALVFCVRIVMFFSLSMKELSLIVFYERKVLTPHTAYHLTDGGTPFRGKWKCHRDNTQKNTCFSQRWKGEDVWSLLCFFVRHGSDGAMRGKPYAVQANR